MNDEANAAPAITFGLQQEVPYAADRVWSVMGNFSRLPDWFPGIAEFSSEGNYPGALRTIVIPPFPPVQHRLTVQDDAARYTEYRVVAGPGLSEATGFVVTIHIAPRGDSACFIDWQARLAQRPSLVPAGAEAAFAARTEQNYGKALAHFCALLEKEARGA